MCCLRNARQQKKSKQSRSESREECELLLQLLSGTQVKQQLISVPVNSREKRGRETDLCQKAS